MDQPPPLTIDQLREISARLRTYARSLLDLRLKRKLAEAALDLAEVAEALGRQDEKERDLAARAAQEAEADLRSAETKNPFAAAADRSITTEHARRWRFKAAEYRATADITQSAVARASYFRLAENYDRLADQADGMMARGEGKPKTG